MRISKGACLGALVASSTGWVWGCGDSPSSSDSQSQAGSANTAGSSSVPSGGAAARAGGPHTANGGAAASGASGAHGGSVSAVAGAAGTLSGGSSGAANGGSKGGSSGAANGGSKGGSSGAANGGSKGGSSGAANGGSSGAASGGAGAAGGGGGTPVKSAGCGKAAPLTAATQQSLTIETAARSYLLVPPASYDNNTAYSVIFAFHGSGGNGAGLRQSVNLEEPTEKKAIFVYVDGAGGIWDLKNNGSDAKLFDGIMATLSANWCIDTGAVFALGFSYGGWAATQIASARPNVVRAIASIAGGGPQGSSNSDPAVAAMIIHGTADTAEPIAAGVGSRDHFVKINGCASTSKAASPTPCVAYDGCKPKKSVYWCQHDGGHGVPAFAPSGMWAFFNSMR